MGEAGLGGAVLAAWLCWAWLGRGCGCVEGVAGIGAWLLGVAGAWPG